MKPVRPFEWLAIIAFLTAPLVFLFRVGQTFAENTTVPEPPWMMIAAAVAAAMALVDFVLPYYLRRLEQTRSQDAPGLFQSPGKSLIVGSALTFSPTVYGFVLLMLGLPFDIFRLFAVASFVAVAAWVAYWLRIR